MAMGTSGPRAPAALKDTSSHGRAAGLALTCEQRTHVTHSRLEDRVSADDTLNVAWKRQLDRAGMAHQFVGAKKVHGGEYVREPRAFGCHDAGGHPCRRRRPRSEL